MLYVRQLRQAGGKFFTDNEVRVHHVQSYGFWKTFSIHYHNGRSIAGYRKPGLSGSRRLLRLASCFVLPAFLVGRSTYPILQKRRFRKELLLSFPLMILLACCHALGEVVGYCAGPGHSPERLS